MKRPYDRPEVVTYSASDLLATLGPARAIYDGNGLSGSPDAAVTSAGTSDLSKR